MSNLGQFYGKGFPIGSLVSGVFSTKQNTYTAPDGTIWLNPQAIMDPLPYDNSYSYLPDDCVMSAKLMNGPLNGGYGIYASNTNQVSLAADPTNQIYITNSMHGSGTGGYVYYRTANGGTTWTEHTFPNLLSYRWVKYIGGRFMAISNTATNGCIVSNDGITWTSYNIIASSSYGDVIEGNANNLVSFTSSSCCYSTDNGQTWAASTGFSSIMSQRSQGIGVMTWNASAGLFVAKLNSNAGYITSPTGATWTTRTPDSFIKYTEVSSGLFYSSLAPALASSPTKTIIFGGSGGYMTTTDCLTWSELKWIDSIGGATCNLAYYDGTRFVVSYGFRFWYSTDGETWTEAPSVHTSNLNQCVYTGNRLFLTANAQYWAWPLFYIDDITDTTRRFIVHKNSTPSTSSSTIMRIR